jgi:hypothetical protein
MRGTVPAVPQYVFTACCLVKTGTNLPLHLPSDKVDRNIYYLKSLKPPYTELGD